MKIPLTQTESETQTDLIDFLEPTSDYYSETSTTAESQNEAVAQACQSSRKLKRKTETSKITGNTERLPASKRSKKSPQGKIHHIATVACSGTSNCSEIVHRYKPLVHERKIPIITATLGPVQEMHEIGTGTAVTVIHQTAWHKYVNYCRRNDRDVSDWDEFWTLPHNVRQDHSIWVSRHQSEDILAVGPFRAELLIDGSHVITNAYGR